jgi:hypothetical protein
MLSGRRAGEIRSCVGEANRWSIPAPVTRSGARPVRGRSQRLVSVGGGRGERAGADRRTRAGRIAATQAEKAKTLRPYEPNKAEVWVKKLEEQFITGSLHWHPFFESAYAGGGFTLGAGYADHIGSYNTIDFRGSYTFSGYKRIESEFFAPRLFGRRGTLSVIGGWREATSVGFYGIGTDNTSKDDRANYSFRQPYGSATLDVRPARRVLHLSGGVEYSQWDQGSGDGTAPSVEEVYTPDTLSGLGAKITYLHTQGTVALDWRTSAGYSRHGGYYGATIHDSADADDIYGFRTIDYEASQHLPILRDAFVLSLRSSRDHQQTGQAFVLHAAGARRACAGSSWRFRDRHSLLLQAEWRVLVNSFFDTAIFVDAGKVTASRSDLDFEDLKTDYGIGFRMHGPAATPLRIEFAKSNEGLVIVFSAKASF